MVYILFNPNANNGRGTEGLDAVLAAAGERCRGMTPELVDVTGTDAAALLLGLKADDEAIVCGGDGTLHYLVNGLNGAVPAAPVYVWRMGTGNDFLRDVLDGKDARMVRLNEYIKNLPVCEVNGRRRRFLNNASLGLDGQVCELGEQEKARLGRPVNYIRLTLRLLFRDFHPFRATVTVDGESRTYERVWVASAFNGRFVGGGQKLAPDQDRLSDKLCCVVLHSMGRVGALFKLPKALAGKHGSLPQCDVRFGREVAVTVDAAASLNLDGEPMGRVGGYRAVKQRAPCEKRGGVIK